MMDFAVALAPLAGFTDKAFRELCKEFGAEFVTTEMVSAKGLYYGDKKTTTLLDFSEREQPLSIQLFGSEAETMAYAATQVAKLEPAYLDINMGCPVPKIFGSGDGSALMQRPDKAAEVIQAVVAATNIPVSVKFRLGIDEAHVNAVAFAKMCEQAGASAITLHARTRQQMYAGKADWSYIRSVKQAVRIFVWGNGDVRSPEDAVAMVEQTGCDGVMIGRGALGNPFLFAQIKEYKQSGRYKHYSVSERVNTAIRHVEMMCSYKPEFIAIPQARKHLAFYVRGLPGAAACKNAIFSATTVAEIRHILLKFFMSREGDLAHEER